VPVLEWIAPAGAGRLDRALADAFPELSRVRIQALCADGRVTTDGRALAAKEKVGEGTAVEIEVPEAVSIALIPEHHSLPVLFEDAHVVVVVKPAGMPTHPGPGHATGTLVHALLGQVNSLSGIGGEIRPGIVHRLDAGTSGVMVAAKDDAAHRALAEQFAVHSVERRYLALVHRVPAFDRGVQRSSIGRDPSHRIRMASVEHGGREAITHWEVRGRGDRVALLECRLETGRTHQVRVHLSEMGHPIAGDALYARRDCVPPAGIRAAVEALEHPLLHAYRLAFTHPVSGERVDRSAPVPEPFIHVCAAAGIAVG
jgi:23S rRNA pseudouridine1911/1915/1917 synthase